MGIKDKINEMMDKSAFLWSNEYDLVRSIAEQMKIGRVLSYKQEKAINNVFSRFKNRQEPVFVNGGAPGSGKRK